LSSVAIADLSLRESSRAFSNCPSCSSGWILSQVRRLARVAANEDEIAFSDDAEADDAHDDDRDHPDAAGGNELDGSQQVLHCQTPQLKLIAIAKLVEVESA
jgi:hypothetical protein